LKGVGNFSFLQSWTRNNFHALEIALNVLKYMKCKQFNPCSTLKTFPSNATVLKKSPLLLTGVDKTDEVLTPT